MSRGQLPIFMGGQYPRDADCREKTTEIDTPQREFNRIAEIQGRVWDIAPQIPGFLQEASFENIDMIEHVCPFGTWPKDPRLKEIGRYFRAQMVEGAMESYSLALFTRFGGWKPVEVQVLLAHLRTEIQSNKIHAYTKMSAKAS